MIMKTNSNKLCIFLVSLFFMSLSTYAQNTKAVVDLQGRIVGKYEATVGQYLCVYWNGESIAGIHKSKAKIITITPASGKGVVWGFSDGYGKIYSKPSFSSRSLCGFNYGDEAECIGYSNGWYKVKTPSRRIGYVSKKHGDLWVSSNSYYENGAGFKQLKFFLPTEDGWREWKE